MSNYNSLKSTIDANVKQNGRQEITGQILNSVLNQMVTTLGAGYQFAGVATTATNPGSPDAKVFYIANGKGTYKKFGGINVTEDDIVILYYDTEWHKEATGIASQEKLTELEEEIAPTSSWLFLQSLIVIGEYYDVTGQIAKSESYCRLKLIKTTSSKIYLKGFRGITKSISGRLLNNNKEVISTISINGEIEELDIDVNTAYIGFYTQGSFPKQSAIIFSNPLNDEIRDIEKETDTLDSNLVALKRKIEENDIINKILTEPITIKSSGAIMTDGSVNSTTNFGYSQPIKLKRGNILNVKLLAFNTMAAIAVTNENGSFLSVGVAGYDSSSNIYDYTYEAEDDCYVVVTSNVNYDRFPKSCLIRDQRVNYYDKELGQFIIEKNKENLLNPNEALVGYYIKDGVIGGGNTQYIATGFIPVIEGEVYEVFTNPLLKTTLNPVYQKRFRFINFYDENKKLVSSSSTEVTSITIPNGVAYMRVTIYRGNDATNNNLRSVQDACITTFGKYSPFLSDSSISLNIDSGYNEKSIVGYGRIQKMLSEHCGSLTGQKWVACGDSFTGGGYDGHTESNTFQNEPYAGVYKHYPAYIGRRNNMIIVNEAVGGTSMAWEDVASHESFAKPNGRYTQIPKDADIITLMFGINDKNYNLPLGEEDSTDVTTFYGAWNVVMRYLISNHPDARLGIIITCGAQTPTQMKEYTDIERAIAKKYGVPYLDLAASDKVPYIMRQWEKTEVADDIKMERDAYYAVSNSNHHPNEKAHLKLSYVIEDWIRSL